MEKIPNPNIENTHSQNHSIVISISKDYSNDNSIENKYQNMINKIDFEENEKGEKKQNINENFAKIFFDEIVNEFKNDLKTTQTAVKTHKFNFGKTKQIQPITNNTVFSINSKKPGIILRKQTKKMSCNKNITKSKNFLISNAKNNTYLKNILENHLRTSSYIEITKTEIFNESLKNEKNDLIKNDNSLILTKNEQSFDNNSFSAEVSDDQEKSEMINEEILSREGKTEISFKILENNSSVLLNNSEQFLQSKINSPLKSINLSVFEKSFESKKVKNDKNLELEKLKARKIEEEKVFHEILQMTNEVLLKG